MSQCSQEKAYFIHAGGVAPLAEIRSLTRPLNLRVLCTQNTQKRERKEKVDWRRVFLDPSTSRPIKKWQIRSIKGRWPLFHSFFFLVNVYYTARLLTIVDISFNYQNIHMDASTFVYILQWNRHALKAAERMAKSWESSKNKGQNV